MEKSFTLDIFEGPLAFLLHLIQKSEINIHDIPIQAITKQYSERIQEWLSPSVDDGAEFISTTALLLLIKSKRLLPKHDDTQGFPEEDLDPDFEIIHKLLEYCHFKEAAIELALREEKQSVYFKRGVHSLPEAPQQLGIEHLTINDLSLLFEKIIKQSHSLNQKITEEEWRVSDKINDIRSFLKETGKISFGFLFSEKICKPELIVNFLALLELMKTGECFVAKEASSPHIYIYEGSYEAAIDENL